MRIHILTTEQLRQLVEAGGGDVDSLTHTNDPEVNYSVDCLVEGDEQVPEYDPRRYAEEVEDFEILVS